MKNITYINRATALPEEEKVPGEGMLKWLYNRPLGKASLHVMVKRKTLSMVFGWFMSSPFSRKQIRKFIRNYDMDMSIYEKPEKGFKTFNQFFYRKIKPQARPIAEGIVSPADGKALAFDCVQDVRSFFIKGTEFTVEEFICDACIADKYADGSMLIVRLAPTDYHRFHFPATGIISKSDRIKGRYYSVSPLALNKSLEIFLQNKRECSQLKTKEYGDVLICEVGATMVGSILQTYTPNSQVEKGDEKGYFAFGGSTVVLLFEKGKVTFDEDLLENTRNGMETTLKMGEQIGV